MSGKEYSRREKNKILENNGYRIIRLNGSHQIYKNDNNHIIVVPVNCNKMIFQRLLKENNLNDSI